MHEVALPRTKKKSASSGWVPEKIVRNWPPMYKVLATRGFVRFANLKQKYDRAVMQTYANNMARPEVKAKTSKKVEWEESERNGCVPLHVESAHSEMRSP